MNEVDIVDVIAGAVIVIATLYDVFQSVVMPRPAVGRVRISPTFVRRAWVVWRWVAQRLRPLQTREAALAVFAPMMVVWLLVMWAFLLIAGYALLYNGLHAGLQPAPGSYGAALQYSASRMLAFSSGNVATAGTVTPVLTTIEAASGFGLFALVISLLFSLFSAFQRRETAVVALDALAGAPPTGVQLLESCAKFDMPATLVSTFETWQIWTADVLESHLAYPLLLFFRSSHDNEAWPNSFGAVLDAAALVITTIDGGPAGPAHLMYKVGDHFVTDMRRYLGYDDALNPRVEREEFEAAAQRLRRAGYRIRDVDVAWPEFSRLRGGYGPWLNRVTRSLLVPPAPWIGDRSYLPHRDGTPRAAGLSARSPSRRSPAAPAR